MSAELARWLTDHQLMLLPRWTSAMSLRAPSNGHGSYSDPAPASIAVDDAPLPAEALEEMYSGLVLAANGDTTTLDEHLRQISQSNDIDVISLPDVMMITSRFRRLAWELFQNEQRDPASTFALMDELETLLEHVIEVISHAWMQTSERAIRTRIEEAEFIAKSMNEAIEQADRTAVQLSSLNEISQRLSSSLENVDHTEIVSFVGTKLAEILDVAHISIWMPDEAQQQETSDVVLYAVQSWGREAQPVSGIRLRGMPYESLGDDTVLRSYMLSQTVTHFAPRPDSATQGAWYQPGCGVIALPLMVKDRAIGVVVLQDTNPTETLSSAHQDTLRAVVNQAAIALDNARLYDRVRRFNSDLEREIKLRTGELEAEKDRLRTLHEIAAEVSSTLDLDTLLHTSLEALARITRVEYGSIMLVDQETEHLVNRAVLGQQEPNTFTRFPLGKGIAGWVAQHKKPALIPDITQDERWVPLPGDESNRKQCGSMISVPLIVHNERLGVLTLSHQEANYFNDDHLRLLTASAGAIAIGIHNANLYAAIVSEMEHRSELLRRQQMETTKIEAILQSISDGVLVCDTEGNVLSTNQACSSILQRGLEDVLLANLHDILKSLLSARVDDLPLAELISHPLGTNEQPRIFESTVEVGMRIVSLTLGPVLKEDGELIGALLMLRDTTREVESDRLKTEFIGTMSHELRTPMTSIKGFTQLLVMGSLGPVNDTQREFLNTIQTNAERMISIINDVLELTKIETGSIDLEVRELHLAEALSGVVSELQAMADKREHTLTINIPPGLPLVRADSTRLHQVLFNLVSNGIKYTDQGGEIVVEAHEAALEELPEHVRDCVLSDRRYTQIDVRDTGVGIAPHELDRVFERFYRTENRLKVEAGGTGLGLSLTRPLVELLGGRIWVESTPGEGTTFSFILPAVDLR
jgi:signal transduction histidine kinase